MHSQRVDRINARIDIRYRRVNVLSFSEALALVCRESPDLNLARGKSNSKSPWLPALKKPNDVREEIPCEARVQVFDSSASQ
jgi:hypothetical protein